MEFIFKLITFTAAIVALILLAKARHGKTVLYHCSYALVLTFWKKYPYFIKRSSPSKWPLLKHLLQFL